MAPRFHLRLDEGSGRLELARPLRVGPFGIETLCLSLGSLGGAVELGAGAGRFRHRRSRVLTARVTVEGDRLRDHGVELGAGEARADGSDLRVQAREPLHALLDQLDLVDVLHEPPDLRIKNPLHPLLVEAMVPHGWRAPDATGAALSLGRDGDRWVLEAEQRL
jgi:hypothetical protein